jgi:DNA adenine methylase
MTSILRWAGSKRKLINELRSLTPKKFTNYIEPFAGSAVLFFDLPQTKGILGDINPEVVATYSAIKHTPAEVILYLESIPKTSDAYYKLRSINPESLDNNQRAARLIFLMKACFNGVYRTNKNGQFNVPLGNKFFSLPDTKAIESASIKLSSMTIVCSDYLEVINMAKTGDFIYLDPPYSDSNRFRGEYSYKGAFRSDDLNRLIDTCISATERNVKILLSFKESDEITQSLPGWKFKKIEVARSVSGFASSRRVAREILAYNYTVD